MAKKTMFINDLFTEFEFDSFPNTERIDDSIKLEYIKQMILLAKSDKQAVFMYLAFALASTAFLIDKLDVFVRSAGYVYLIIFYVDISLLMISAVFFFTYWRKIHKYQINTVSCIPNLNINKARELWVQVWNKNNNYFKMGLWSLSLGTFFLFIVILISELMPT